MEKGYGYAGHKDQNQQHSIGWGNTDEAHGNGGQGRGQDHQPACQAFVVGKQANERVGQGWDLHDRG